MIVDLPLPKAWRWGSVTDGGPSDGHAVVNPLQAGDVLRGLLAGFLQLAPRWIRAAGCTDPAGRAFDGIPDGPRWRPPVVFSASELICLALASCFPGWLSGRPRRPASPCRPGIRAPAAAIRGPAGRCPGRAGGSGVGFRDELLIALDFRDQKIFLWRIAPCARRSNCRCRRRASRRPRRPARPDAFVAVADGGRRASRPPARRPPRLRRRFAAGRPWCRRAWWRSRPVTRR
jgi:hypothetical protein